jgi:hypothetical protein
MNAAVMCEFTKEEFTQGLVKLNCDSIEKLKKKLPELRTELQDADKFRDIYNYAYMFSREVRSLPYPRARIGRPISCSCSSHSACRGLRT